MSKVTRQPPEQLPASFGRYRLVKLLGRGGMGSVYLAHDSQLDRSVALKIPQLDTAGDAQVLARFYIEARAAAALTHPNICPIHDVGEIDDLPYLTMAYIEGKPLEALVRDRPLTPRQGVILVRKLAAALHEAHKRGIIHRDLKPANIMIDRRGEPVIMDFGLARRVRPNEVRLTQTGSAMGTPSYMPPEQVQGDLAAMGPASDVYSLGVILYELLAGRLPFTGDLMAVLSQVLLEEPPPPSRFRSDLDRNLEAICLKAMAKKVKDRHASMAELAAELTEHLRTRPAAAADGAKCEDVTLPPASHAPRQEEETQSEGIRVSQMGGMRSVAQLHAHLPTTRSKDGAPPRKRRPKEHGRRRPLWLGLGVGAAALAGLLAWVVFRPATFGTIRIALSPASAPVEIQVDGQAVPQTGAELRLSLGPHQLTVVGQDHETEQQTFTVHRGRNADLQVALRLRKIPDPGAERQPAVPAAPVKRTKPPGVPAATANLLDDAMRQNLAKIGCTAGALAVERNGALLYAQGFGFRFKDQRDPAGPDTLFGVQNPTKAMLVAASVRHLATKKRIRLKDPILSILKIEPRGKVVDPRFSTITVKHLLDEKPGWDRDTLRDARKAAQAQGFKSPIPTDVMLGFFMTQPLKHDPGAGPTGSPPIYCYLTLMHLVKQVTGRTWQDYVREELLGRKLNGIAAPGTPEAAAGTVWNALNGDVCISAPSMLEVMREYAFDGKRRPGAGSWVWGSNSYYLCQLNWRADGLNVVILFNGRAPRVEEFADVHKALDTLKAGGK